jgi:hypothetical protein
MRITDCIKHIARPVFHILLLLVCTGLFSTLVALPVAETASQPDLALLIAQATTNSAQNMAAKTNSTVSLTERDNQNNHVSAWKIRKWTCLGTGILLGGAGFYYNLQGKNFSDDYTSATTTSAANENWDKAEKSFQTRNFLYIGASTVTACSIYSWFKQKQHAERNK